MRTTANLPLSLDEWPRDSCHGPALEAFTAAEAREFFGAEPSSRNDFALREISIAVLLVYKNDTPKVNLGVAGKQA